MGRIAGTVVAITGGARGIGRATAAALLGRGAKVAIGDIDLAAARATAGELAADLGVSGDDRIVALPLDVTDTAGFRDFLDDAEAALGPLDTLVNNAGIMVVGDFVKEEQAATDAMVDINLGGVLRGCRLVLPRLLERSSGHIVNIASMAGVTATPGGATYAATKHAVVGLTNSLRAEVRGSGVLLSLVMPTVVDTQLGAGLGQTIAPVLSPEDVAAAIVHVLETEKNEITVPRWVAGIAKPASVLPSKAQAWLSAKLGGEEALSDTDPAERDAYESEYRGRR